ncbi:MAG TPA: hypothetical protein VGK89_13500 [Candidatus Eisenbacteria bacterium]|jgi:hypothetical protein
MSRAALGSRLAPAAAVALALALAAALAPRECAALPEAARAFAAPAAAEEWSGAATSPVLGAGRPAPPPMASALALEAPTLEWIGLGRGKTRPITSKERGRAGLPMLSAARAQILLRSLTVPGWGQATIGRKGSAKLFLLAEAGVWATFTSFRIQEQLRRQSYERSARLLAGIDLHGRDEEFRRIVGGFRSNDEYNLYVVARDAANLYYDDPDRYWAYIASHSLTGRNAWSWKSDGDLLRYRAQRKDAQRAAQRANTAVAVAIANRFVSALHAARLAGRQDSGKHSWNFEVAPGAAEDAMAFRCGVRARF